MTERRKINTQKKKFNLSKRVRHFTYFISRFYDSVALDFWSNFHDDFENGVKYSLGLSNGWFRFSNCVLNHFQKKAKKALERFISNNPDDKRASVAHSHLGKVYLRQGDEKSALSQLEKAVQNPTLDSDPLIEELGEELVRVIEEKIQKNPGNPELYSEFTNVYRKANLKHNRLGLGSAEILKRALELQPNSPDIHILMGNEIYSYRRNYISPEEWEEMEDLKSRKETREIIISEAKNEESFLRRLCNTPRPHNIRKGLIEKALSEYREAMRLDPKNGEPHIMTGAVYFYEGRCDEAIKEFERAIEIDHKNILIKPVIDAIKNKGRIVQIQNDEHQILQNFITSCDTERNPEVADGIHKFIEVPVVVVQKKPYEYTYHNRIFITPKSDEEQRFINTYMTFHTGPLPLSFIRVSLSGVEIDNEGEATVYHDVYFAPQVAHGETIKLKKINGEWKQTDTLMEWIS